VNFDDPRLGAPRFRKISATEEIGFYRFSPRTSSVIPA